MIPGGPTDTVTFPGPAGSSSFHIQVRPPPMRRIRHISASTSARDAARSGIPYRSI